MARKKQIKEKIKPTIRENNESFQPGDYCYFVVSHENKPKFAEVVKVISVDNRPVYTVIEQSDQKYCVVPHENCFDSEKEAKEFKAKNKCK